MKIIRNNIFNTSEVKYSDIIDQTLSVLLEEMDKYEELRESTLLKIKDKEDYLDGLGENLHEKAKVLRTQLIQLKDLIIGIGLAKSAASTRIFMLSLIKLIGFRLCPFLIIWATYSNATMITVNNRPPY